MARKLKTKGVSYWTKKLDTVFSQYIRLKYAGPNGMVQCFTCKKIRHYKDSMHCGHFHDRKWMGVRWDEDNVRPQCAYCNTYRAGRGPDFAVYLLEEIGKDRMDALFKKRLHLWCPADLEQMYDEYRVKVKELEKHVNRLNVLS